MPVYSFEAFDSDGKVFKNTVAAASRAALVDRLETMGLVITDLTEARAAVPLSPTLVQSIIQRLKGLPFLRRRFDTALFLRQLATMYEAGVPVPKAVLTIAKQAEKGALQDALIRMRFDLSKGESLSKTMGRFPDLFPEMYVRLIRAGETGGALLDVLDQLATYEEKEAGLKKKVWAALTYPVCVFLIALVVVFFLMQYLFSNLLPIFAHSKLTLPLPTLILMQGTRFFSHPLGILVSLVLLAVLILLGFERLQAPGFRKRWHKQSLRIPLFGGVVLKLVIVRFCRTLAMLYRAGIPMLSAVEESAHSCGNQWIEDGLGPLQGDLKAGKALSSSLRLRTSFPPLVASMVYVGEEAGELAEMLDKVAGFYELSVDELMNKLASIMEPVMILVIGFWVGLIALSALLPLYKLFERLS